MLFTNDLHQQRDLRQSIMPVAKAEQAMPNRDRWLYKHQDLAVNAKQLASAKACDMEQGGHHSGGVGSTVAGWETEQKGA